MALSQTAGSPPLFASLQPIAAEVSSAAVAVLAGGVAERIIDRLLRSHPKWTGAERGAAATAIFGVGLWRRRLAWHLGEASASAPGQMWIAALLRVVHGVGSSEAATWSGGRIDEGRWRFEAPDDLALRWSFPDWLADELRRTFGSGAEEYARALCERGPVTLRVNTLCTSRASLETRLAEEGVQTQAAALARAGLRITSERPNIFGLGAYRDGAFEVQDEGSQLLGEWVDAQPGEKVLDLCAGAGGKSLQLAAALDNRGRVDAFDVDQERLGRLRDRAARAGASCIRVLPSLEGVGLYDRVLIDAPCSELGALRRGPDLRFRIQPDTFAALEALQRTLLRTGAAHVREGGRLVYATCTFRRSENEEMVAWFEGSVPGFVREPLPASWVAAGVEHDGALVPRPDLHGTDGFFAVAYRRV